MLAERPIIILDRISDIGRSFVQGFAISPLIGEESIYSEHQHLDYYHFLRKMDTADADKEASAACGDSQQYSAAPPPANNKISVVVSRHDAGFSENAYRFVENLFPDKTLVTKYFQARIAFTRREDAKATESERPDAGIVLIYRGLSELRDLLEARPSASAAFSSNSAETGGDGAEEEIAEQFRLAVCVLNAQDGKRNDRGEVSAFRVEEQDDQEREQHIDLCLDHGFQRIAIKEEEVRDFLGRERDDTQLLPAQKPFPIGSLLRGAHPESCGAEPNSFVDQSAADVSATEEIRETFLCHMWPVIQPVEAKKKTETNEGRTTSPASPIRRDLGVVIKNRESDALLRDSTPSTDDASPALEPTSRGAEDGDLVLSSDSPSKVASTALHQEVAGAQRECCEKARQGQKPATSVELENAAEEDQAEHLEALDTLMQHMRSAHVQAKNENLSDDARRNRAEELAMRMMELLELSDEDEK
ncbi:unnamed protein product [Amoebophrya sp. A120]|nr:unnamed protein product [Amoebophrya sp. A120]CAD7976254.1 unnamed protein product [Amoebophrya sp. A120]|eukprot:GSA120T00026341001.1